MANLNILNSVGGGGGNDPNKLPPPKPDNYIPISVSQRAEWNTFLDYANKQKVNLSDPKIQAATLAQYKKTNPNFSVTPDQIPAIQYEAYQLRKGNSFGSLDSKQLSYIRQGMSPNFLNADTTNVAKLYYPQMGNYGTDLEKYYASKFGSNPTITPRPDYTDQKSREKYLQTLAAQPGNSFVHNRGDSIIHIDEVPTYGNISAKQAALQEAKKQGLDPALLYSSSMEEGANGLYPDKNGDINSGEGTSDKYPVSGFGNYGLDNFHGDFKDIVKKGYLPKDFDYEPSYHKNENGDKVPSANFKNTEDAMAAKAAYVHYYQDKLDDYTKKAGITLSPTARQFFTLVSFNGGPGTEKKLLKYYQQKGLLEGDKFLQSPPDKSVDPGGAYDHILVRFKMADLLKKEKYF